MFSALSNTQRKRVSENQTELQRNYFAFERLISFFHASHPHENEKVPYCGTVTHSGGHTEVK
jgi:hypothetical protein